MLYLGIVILVLLLVLIFEFRLKKPDQIVLFEKNNVVKTRKGKFYPRHFSLAIPSVSHSLTMNIDSEAKGKLQLEIKLAVSLAASIENISTLIRIGGWNKKAVQNASKEVEIVIQGLVKDFTEKFEVDEISSEKIYSHLKKELKDAASNLGLDLLSLSIQSVDLADKEIAEALRQREEARIRESAEVTNQKARISAAEAKLEADEKIAMAEHTLALKKLELKKAEEVEESVLALKRIEDEMKRNNLQLDYDKKELEMIKDNPELLMLTPQIARLAEASQSLKNAKTVVNLSGEQMDKGNEVAGIFHTFLHSMISKYSGKKDNK